MKNILFIQLLVLCSFQVWGASVELELDETSISVGEEISFKVIISGSRQAGFPIIPKVEGLVFESRGSSSQFQIVNGATSISKTFEFSLEAEKEGQYTIGPVKIEVGGQNLTSKSLKLKVAKASKEQKNDMAKYFHVDVDVSNETPYLNEQIIYTFKFSRRVRLQNASVDLPDFDDFWKENLVEEKTIRKNINGEIWTITEIKYALFPQKVGNLIIPATKFSGYVLIQDRNSRSRRRGGFGFFEDSFFGSQMGKQKKVSTASKNITVKVQPLPEYNGEGKFSGLVGDFDLSAKVDQTNLKVGESLTLNVGLSGQGNIFDAIIKLPDTSNFKSYDDEPSFVKDNNENAFSGLKKFKKALVPLKEGKTKIPAIKLIVFDPQAKSYKTLSTEEIKLSIIPGESYANSINHTQALSNTNNVKKVETLGKDLSNIKMSTSVLGKEVQSRWFFYLLIFCPFLINIFMYFNNKRKSFKNNNKSVFRQKDALGNFNKKLGSNNEQNYKSFKELIGDLLLIDGGALTDQQIIDHLDKKNVSRGIIEEVKKNFEKYEMIQFAGSDSVSKTELSKNLKSLAQKITKELK